VNYEFSPFVLVTRSGVQRQWLIVLETILIFIHGLIWPSSLGVRSVWLPSGDSSWKRGVWA
jgi:hypothetical protein